MAEQAPPKPRQSDRSGSPMNHRMLVRDLLEASAARWPAKVALLCAGKRWTYVELDGAANRLSQLLQERGVERGDRVGLYLNNSAALVVAIFAVLKAGAVFVPVNRATKSEKLAFILNNCQAVGLITDRRATNQAVGSDFLASVPSLQAIVVCTPGGVAFSPGNSRYREFEVVAESAPHATPPCVNIDLDLACLIYTSGTTGEPKGVMCDHSNMVFVTQAIVSYLKNNQADVILNVLPLSFSYGLYQLLATFSTAATLVLEESFTFPASVLETMAEERVTGFAGVPTIYSMLLGMDLSAYDLSSLRYLTNAAAGLPVEHVKRLRQTLPKVELVLMHGLTEVARTMYLPPDQVEKRPGASGIAIPGTELWIEDEHGNRLGSEQVGELVVRGRHVMRGYWGDSKRTAERFRPGFLPGERVCYSGDLFRTDAEGYFYFVSRKDDIIKCRGEKVAPREVENVLYKIPGVRDAAVIGMPDPVMGQAVKAFIVAPEGNLTVATVIAHCRKHLEDVMVPQQVEFRVELPKTSSGKIRKLDLR